MSVSPKFFYILLEKYLKHATHMKTPFIDKKKNDNM